MNQNRIENAAEYFKNGFNCAQSVLAAYCEEFGLDKETALKLSCGFGGGMGRLGGTCGAVTGAYMLIGLKYANALTSKEDNITKEKVHSKIREFAKLFEERNKTTVCRELLGVDFIIDNNQATDEKKQIINERIKEICPQMVRDAAEIVEKLLIF